MVLRYFCRPSVTLFIKSDCKYCIGLEAGETQTAPRELPIRFPPISNVLPHVEQKNFCIFYRHSLWKLLKLHLIFDESEGFGHDSICGS
jgi:hypothetical protein